MPTVLSWLKVKRWNRSHSELQPRSPGRDRNLNAPGLGPLPPFPAHPPSNCSESCSIYTQCLRLRKERPPSAIRAQNPQLPLRAQSMGPSWSLISSAPNMTVPPTGSLMSTRTVTRQRYQSCDCAGHSCQVFTGRHLCLQLG